MKKLLLLFVAIAAGALLVQACSVSTASVADVKICDSMTGDECDEDQQIISPAATVIYCSGKLNDAPEGTKMVITWRYLTEPQDIDSITLETDESGSGPFSSSLGRPDAGWPTGRYECLLDLGTDNAEPIHKEFEIR